jgi:hypothetical protein
LKSENTNIDSNCHLGTNPLKKVDNPNMQPLINTYDIFEKLLEDEDENEDDAIYQK